MLLSLFMSKKMGFVDVYVWNKQKNAERTEGKAEAFNEAIKMLFFFFLIVLYY
jgi:hypothetical protein